MARIRLSLQIGPMVRVDIEGENCPDITESLRGFEQLNQTVDAMFADLAKRVFPETEAPSSSSEKHR
jgi:hypothetical protein